ncbi:MAG: primosomal protein N' [Planctomycetota bacterium]
MTVAQGSLWQEPEPESEAAGPFAEVAIKVPVRTEFTYRVPPPLAVQVGSRVHVPFRGKTLAGIVVATHEQSALDPRKVRDVIEVLDANLVLPDAVLALCRKIAHDYGCSLGEALDAALPAAIKRRGARRVPSLELAVSREIAAQAILELEDKHGARARVLRTVLEYGAPMPITQVRRRTGTSDSPWKTLVRHGSLRRVMVREESEGWQPAEGTEAAIVELNDEQRHCVETIAAALDAAEPKPFLLHGVTGSGKTEVYLQALERVRARGRTAIVLVPEISLTPQTVGRFASRFTDVAVLHSGLTDAERGRQWQRLARGEAKIAIGARSALFAPVLDLGLIVVDEEHDGSFKQDSTPRYHAREMAVERGRLEKAVVVLGSATPTLESYGRARRGVYEMLELPNRAGKGTLPRIVVEDLRGAGHDGRVDGVQLSRTLQVMMRERLDARDQILLFLNRRGFSPVLICPACGTPVKCERCAVSMTFHRVRGRLICHYCCEDRRRPEICDICEHAGFHELGAGTERLAAAVSKLFPEAVVARMDADTMAERGAVERVLTAFRKKQIDVLVGTQMIAKGHDFPDVTLVGVVAADVGLFVPDFRAAERTFQLLYQVAGRAGRAAKPGVVVLQSLSPENYAVAAAAALDFETFVQRELAYRKELGYPPFARLVRVLFESPRDAEARDAARLVRGEILDGEGRRTLGPAPAVLTKIKDRYRWHTLTKCFTPEAFDDAMGVLRTVEDRATRTLRVTLDVDPVSML